MRLLARTLARPYRRMVRELRPRQTSVHLSAEQRASNQNTHRELSTRGVGPNLYNSLSEETEPLPRPFDGCDSATLRYLTWYSCGPTVYDSTHLGHARSYVNTDIIRRILTDFFGYKVHFVLGMTDIDDKIVARASELGESPANLARRYESEFMEDLAALNVLEPSVVTRVTEHIPEIINYIGEIMRNGHAYELEDGVYFDVASLGDRYAEKLGPSLARQANAGAVDGQDHVEDIEVGDTDEVSNASKRDSRDFALWKRHERADSSSVTWDSPWGPGRPGWHIECSAMVDTVLGSNFDIHSGGIDLCFPHHCNEIAQAQAFLQKEEWAKFFMHTGHLHISGRKMSKSLKNFITVRELLGRETDDSVSTSDCFRMFVLCHHYRSNITFSEDRLEDASKEIHKFRRFLERLQTFNEKGATPLIDENGYEEVHIDGALNSRHQHRSFFVQAIQDAEKSVHGALVDDFNTPKAISALREFCSAVNCYLDRVDDDRCSGKNHRQSSGESRVPDEVLSSASQVIAGTFGRLGLDLDSSSKSNLDELGDRREEAAVKALVDLRAAIREAARKKVSWGEIYKLCDDVRDVTAPDLGWKITDGKGGTTYRRL